jgi:hypothetical protein
LTDLAPIDFEFGFTGTARTDSAAQPREVRTQSDQIGLSVFQLRELDLQLALTTARVSREDVQDQHRAIDDRQGNDLLEILALTRSKVVKDEHDRCVDRGGVLGDFVRFAAPNERRGIDARTTLNDPIDHGRTGSFDQRFEFDQFGF